MSFLIKCPICGNRSVYEFRHGGERLIRPMPSADEEQWSEFNYLRQNAFDLQWEWWNHNMGCRRWFLAERDTRTNRVVSTRLAAQPENDEQT